MSVEKRLAALERRAAEANKPDPVKDAWVSDPELRQLWQELHEYLAAAPTEAAEAYRARFTTPPTTDGDFGDFYDLLAKADDAKPYLYRIVERQRQVRGEVEADGLYQAYRAARPDGASRELWNEL